MNSRIIAAVALSLSFGTAAVAQTSLETETGYNAGMPTGWEGDISEALFEDQELGTLRQEADVRTNFQELGPDQQAMVRSHCALVDTASSGYGADSNTVAQGIDADVEDDVADLGTDGQVETGSADLDDGLEPETAQMGTSLNDEIETGATVGSTSDIDTDVDRGTDVGATSDLDSDFETGAVEPGVDTEIETGAADIETETEFTQDTDIGVSGDGTMDAQIEASIEQACAWID